MRVTTPRLAVAGLAGDSGKTLVTLGLVAALRRRGRTVAGFKKGPDYIDAAWIGRAAGRPGRNLDTFLMDDRGLATVLAAAADAQIWLLEGNRGLFDGLDARGTHSTAALARRLGFPVLLVVDATKVTRTAAAAVLGCGVLDPGLRIHGVVLNRVGGARHERVLREAFAVAGAPPVIGAIPRVAADLLPGRHLGLVTEAEHRDAAAAIDAAADLVEGHVDLDLVERIAARAAPVDLPDPASDTARRRVRIGVLRDAAFSFYYPENLERLEALGADLVPISPLADASLPPIDALYAGGGFPEQHAGRLAANRPLLDELRRRLEGGLPAWAECGGLILLARELRVGARRHRFAGFLDLELEFGARPAGHGYVEARVVRDNPFLARGRTLRGHEFHYARIVGGADRDATVLELARGHGIDGRTDGLVRGATWASWLHVHALSVPEWAESLVARAAAFRADRQVRSTCSPGIR
ncbi:MAG: cobyrinate a,c-diamide synthase [Acidobacteria bacterium]|nr:MAG: cobyrinate a,c-diamide synthase [Acidobacteriota bacterium]